MDSAQPWAEFFFILPSSRAAIILANYETILNTDRINLSLKKNGVSILLVSILRSGEALEYHDY